MKISEMVDLDGIEAMKTDGSDRVDSYISIEQEKRVRKSNIAKGKRIASERKRLAKKNNPI